MTRMHFSRLALTTLAAALCGCAANYCWRPTVPQEMRTISVPTFANESDVSELGAVATTQIRREIQREGTFKLKPYGEGAVEVQGVIKSASNSVGAYTRRTRTRSVSYDFKVTALVTVIDRLSGRVIANDKKYEAETTFTSGNDLTTGMRDASGRAMEDLARQVVDDLLATDWKKTEKSSKEEK